MNLVNGLFLDSYNILLEYEFSHCRCLETFQNNGIHMDTSRPGYISIVSRLFGFMYDFRIVASFQLDSIAKISISPLLPEQFAVQAHREIQKYIVSSLGPPVTRPIVAVKRLFQTHKDLWEFGDVRIEHYFEERFGLFDIVEVQIASKQ